MKPRRPLGTTYTGLVILAGIGGGGGGLVSAALFLFRKQCEPFLPVILPMLTHAFFRSSFYYRPEQYYWVAAYIGAGAILWTLGIIWTIARKPAQDRHVDRALRLRSRPEARGAPLEP